MIFYYLVQTISIISINIYIIPVIMPYLSSLNHKFTLFSFFLHFFTPCLCLRRNQNILPQFRSFQLPVCHNFRLMVPNQYHITCGRIAHINFLNMEVIYMAAFKNNGRGTWFCRFYYTEYIGEGKQKKKRGFATRKEASEWKRNFLIKEK